MCTVAEGDDPDADEVVSNANIERIDQVFHEGKEAFVVFYPDAAGRVQEEDDVCGLICAVVIVWPVSERSRHKQADDHKYMSIHR